MDKFFKSPVSDLPIADIPVQGCTAFLSQAKDHQILFMQFETDTDLPKHTHSAQVGFVLDGKIDLSINGKSRTYKKGDHYYIPAGIPHSGKIHAGYADITFFNEPDRYALKG